MTKKKECKLSGFFLHDEIVKAYNCGFEDGKTQKDTTEEYKVCIICGLQKCRCKLIEKHTHDSQGHCWDKKCKEKILPADFPSGSAYRSKPNEEWEERFRKDFRVDTDGSVHIREETEWRIDAVETFIRKEKAKDLDKIILELEREKMENVKGESNSDWFYGYGNNQALDQAINIIKKAKE